MLKEVHHELYRCRTLVGAGDGNINPAGALIFKLFRSRIFDRRGCLGVDASRDYVREQSKRQRPIRFGMVFGLYFSSNRSTTMSIGTILLVILVLMLIGVIPAWPHSRAWGYGPSGGLGTLLIILLVLVLLGIL